MQLTSLRERKKERTRQEIIESATRLFLDRGFDATTLDDIAEEAEVSRSTLIRYFGSKESLVFPHLEERLGMFRATLQASEEGESAFMTIRRAVLRLAEVFDGARRELIDQYQIMEASPHLATREVIWDEEWEGAIRQALVRRVASDQAKARRARVLASAIFAIVRTALAEWVQAGCRQDLVQMAEEELDILEQGLRGMAPFLLESREGGQ